MNEKLGPVFIIGCPRSGTSATAWAIAQHPDFSAFEEEMILWQLLSGPRSLSNIYRSSYAVKLNMLKSRHISYDDFLGYMGIGFDRMCADITRGKRWVEQTPENTMVASEISRMFPTSSFIHLIRDGRATVNSMIHSGFPTEWANDFPKACRVWKNFIEKGLIFEHENKERTLQIRQERLLAEPHEVMRDIFQFLCAETCAKAGKFLLKNTLNSSFKIINQPQKPESTDLATNRPANPCADWTDDMKATFRSIAGETMADLGYDCTMEPIATKVINGST